MGFLKSGNIIFTFAVLYLTFYIGACTPAKQISRSANKLIADSSLQAAHIGISIYDAGSGKYWYNHNGDKYFVPASNTKIPTCYAAMKYLGDSLLTFKYQTRNDGTLIIEPNGDPSFLHPGFKQQPAYDFLKKFRRIIVWSSSFDEDFLGSGWSWNDYREYYMAERSQFPIYGNIVTFKRVTDDSIAISPAWFRKDIKAIEKLQGGMDIEKDFFNNAFVIRKGSEQLAEVPFTPDDKTVFDLLRDTLHAVILQEELLDNELSHSLHSRPVDSLLAVMMHQSDNFFAEQSLLMVSNTLLGIMDDGKIVDTLLKTDFGNLPQKPRWVDGSGLSRYNLFSPNDFVAILDKIRTGFGMDRVKTIFPTGGEGTLNNYYINAKNQIYAKTGTLSGVVSVSGFLYTRKNRLLIFSILVNNHRANVTAIRRGVEKFLLGIRDKY